MPDTSTRPGMGAMPYAGGVAFRVWAPSAGQVRVAGDFNGWDENATPLVAEGNGNWSTDVSGAAAGQRYKLVIDGRWKIDPRARDVTNSVGDGVIVSSDYPWQVNDFGMPPWNELVIYEMHAATFPDDPVQKRALFDAIAGDMSYLQELGINAIELMPASEFPGDDSWGYNPSYLFAIEDSYGGPDSLKRLIDSAHQHGIAVILDVVYNHLGPTDLDMWQFDGWFQVWNGEAMGGIYFYNDWRAWTPWGAKNRPDFGRPEVRELIRDNALMWLEDFRMDGLRMDMTTYIRNVYANDHDPLDSPNNLSGWGWNLLRWINDEVNFRQPWKITIAEDMRQNPAITRPTANAGAGFDAQWDDQFHHRVYDVLTAQRDEDRDMYAIRDAIERRYDGDAFRRVIYTESHDEVGAASGGRRLTEAIHPGHADSWYAKKRSTLGAALLFTSPGVPMIFQGQEILEWIPFGDKNRIDWGKYNEFRGIYTLYRDLIRLRRNWFNNTRGLRGQHVNVCHVNNQDKVIAYHRWLAGGSGDDVVVVLNFANRGYTDYHIGLPRAGQWHPRFNSDWRGYDPSFSDWNVSSVFAGGSANHGFGQSAAIALPPYSGVIFSQ